MTSEGGSDHEEPDPAERWFVPVRPGSDRSCGWVVLRLFRTPLGEPTAVAFTSRRRLSAVLGSGQEWVQLSERTLRELITPLGFERITLDPIYSAPAGSPVPEHELVPAMSAANSG